MSMALLLGIAVLFIMVSAVMLVSLNRINTQLSAQKLVDEQLKSIRSDLNERLSDTNKALRETHDSVGRRLDNATKLFGDVATSLGKLQESTKHMLEVGKDISGLQELLRAPKFRGEIGETMLENLLTQVLPKDNFKLQYRFKSGDTVDAVIMLADHLVPVDSKFSLDNFKKMVEATDERDKVTYQKQFTKDIKNRVDEISSKYILPDEGTFDFALMYIMAENVYYEAIVKGDLRNYALSKKVIPVSPNTFYAYLQVICLGLRGMKVEDNVKTVLASLTRLQGDLNKFSETFRVVGVHLKNASEKYSEAENRLEKFSDKLTSVEQSKKIEKL